MSSESLAVCVSRRIEFLRIRSLCRSGVCVLGAALLLGVTSTVIAERFRWLPDPDQLGHWDVSDNWSNDGVPGAADQAFVTGAYVTVNSSQVGELVLFGELTLGRLEVVEKMAISNSILSDRHTLVLQPQVVTDYTGLNATRIIGGAKIINHGLFFIYDEGPLGFEDGGAFFNQSREDSAARAQFIVDINPDFAVDFSLESDLDTGTQFHNENADFINRTPGGVVTVDVPFINSGMVFAEKGGIAFQRGGVHSKALFRTASPNEIDFANQTHEFDLKAGDIIMSSGMVWSGGDFLLSNPNGSIMAEELTVRNPTANLLGAGEISVRNFAFDASEAGGVLKIGGGISLVVLSSTGIRRTGSRIELNGKVSLQSEGILLSDESIIESSPFGDIRFEAAQQQSLRGGSMLKNQGTTRFLSETNLVRTPVVNEGLVLVKSAKCEFEQAFDSAKGSIEVGSNDNPSLVVFKGDTKLAGATLQNESALQLSPRDGPFLGASPTPIFTLDGKFEGQGHLDFNINTWETRGDATFEGVSLKLDVPNSFVSISFSDVLSKHTATWTFEESDRLTMVDLNHNTNFSGPGKIINRSSQHAWSFKLNSADLGVSLSKNMLFRNEGTVLFVPPQHVELKLALRSGSKIENTGQMFIGGEKRLVTFGIDDDSLWDNKRGGTLIFPSTERIELRNAQRLEGDVLFRNEGEIRLERLGAVLLITAVSNLNGPLSMNQGDLILNDTTVTLGPNFKIGSPESVGPEISILDARVVIEDGLRSPGPVTVFGGSEGPPATLELNLDDQLIAPTIDFETIGQSEPLVRVLPPTTFAPERHMGESFQVIEAGSLRGLTLNMVSLDALPTRRASYEAEITATSLRVTILPPATPESSGFDENFDAWVKGIFPAGEQAQTPEGDPDGDGKTNLHEYATGSDPTTADKEGLKIRLRTKDGKTQFEVTYPQAKEAPGTEVKLKTSMDISGPFGPLDPRELDSFEQSTRSTGENTMEHRITFERNPLARQQYFRFDIEVQTDTP